MNPISEELWKDAELPVNALLTDSAKVLILSNMIRARVFEQQTLYHYNSGRMGGWLMLQIGQEGVGAAVRSLLGPLDHTISGVRGLGFPIMTGIPMASCMAELMGRIGGTSKGKAGMFSCFAPHLNHWGVHGLAAAQTPLASGLAFAMKLREIKGAVVCFLGDGAVNQGVYHEVLNLSALFGLPVVFLIENNGYAMGMSVKRSSAFKDYLAQRAETYGIEWDVCGGHDIYAVRACLESALERARNECLPTVIEVETYRYYGFTISDANHKRYRTSDEIEWHKQNRDPLQLWNVRLIEEGVIDGTAFQDIRNSAKQEVLEASRSAQNSPPPKISEITEDVYWEVDHHTEAASHGRYFFND